MLSRAERLKRARITIMRGGVVDGNLVNPHIAESWQRCMAAGLDPHARVPGLRVSDAKLARLRQRDELAHRFASAEMQTLCQQIAGSNYMIAFGNDEGTVLETVCDGDFDASPAGQAIVPGAIWQETRRGTNALGTCAATRQALIVHGEEHFFVDHADVSCFAAPVFHSDGALAGVLDASSDCSARHMHTLALMRMAATHIENSLFLAQQDTHIVLLFHPRQELLNSVSGGLASFDLNGRVVAVNRRGREILSGLSVRPGSTFEAIFDTSFDAALGELSGQAQPFLHDLFGSRYAVLWRNRHRHEQRLQMAFAKRTRRASVDLVQADFVALDAALCSQLAHAARAVRHRVPFLVTGESGTGKDLMARHIHRLTGRKGAFVAVNCGGLSEQMLEAELYGYVPGAFTGARREGAEGLAVAADKGTLFLDEIGDLAIASQVSLLRFLDSGEVRPVGGTKARKVDVQIVAATNVDLEAAIAEKRFREDLFYRLGVVNLTLPPLRARSDFPELANALLAEVSPGTTLTADALNLLKTQAWPGNMRELKTRLLQLALAADHGVITKDLAQLYLGLQQEGEDDGSLRARMRAEISDTLRRNGNNVTRTAKSLGVSRNTVYKYMRIDRDETW